MKINKEKLFEIFLKSYLENVVNELPESYRARQLDMGGVATELVYKFESKFLKEPFMKAMSEMQE